MRTFPLKSIGMAGAGLTCAVIARELAENGLNIQIYESRGQIGGNCSTTRDQSTGILIHNFGPHIFHTSDERVWRYVNRFSRFQPYVNRVRAIVGSRVFSLPINLLTINQFFNRSMSPAEAQRFISELSDSSIEDPNNLEEQALKFMGHELYEAFFKGYTLKQWGTHPRNLPADILKRLPIRFNYDDNYFNDKYQGMPQDGYTALITSILDHANITVTLNSQLTRCDAERFEHLFYSGPIDEYFDYEIGRLRYRTLRFERIDGVGDYQGCAVMNYCNEQVPYTRIAEHKHFTPWEHHERTVCFAEYSSEYDGTGIPFYPVRSQSDLRLLDQYKALATRDSRVTFVGRLGTYRYLDMDKTIRHALDTSENFLAELRTLPSERT